MDTMDFDHILSPFPSLTPPYSFPHFVSFSSNGSRSLSCDAHTCMGGDACMWHMHPTRGHIPEEHDFPFPEATKCLVPQPGVRVMTPSTTHAGMLTCLNLSMGHTGNHGYCQFLGVSALSSLEEAVL